MTKTLIILFLEGLWITLFFCYQIFINILSRPILVNTRDILLQFIIPIAVGIMAPYPLGLMDSDNKLLKGLFVLISLLIVGFIHTWILYSPTFNEREINDKLMICLGVVIMVISAWSLFRKIPTP